MNTPLWSAGLLLAGLVCGTPCVAAEQLRYRYNGLSVEATVARGVEGRSLAARFLDRVPSDAMQGAPAWQTQGPWRQIAVMDAGVSRVLQMRGEGDALEVIASALDTRQAPQGIRAAPLWLPPTALLASQVQFMRPTPSSQWIYRSSWQPAALLTWLRVSAGLRGWHIDAGATPADLQLSRGTERLIVVVAPDATRLAPRGSVVVMTLPCGP